MAKKSKVVEMEPKTNDSVNKLSYEELENAAAYLNEECRKQKAQLIEARNIINGFNEVGLLLSILGKDTFFNDSFVERCAKKIESIVTTALDKEESNRENSNKKEESNE
jgi:hypothetical protein